MADLKDEILLKIWRKGTIIASYNPDLYRQDASGAWIVWKEYGNMESLYGWQVDHIFPKSKLKEAGVPEEFIDDDINLRPMQWENNVSKGDNYPSFITCVKAVDNKNEHINQSRKIIDSYQNILRNFYLKNCKIDIALL